MHPARPRVRTARSASKCTPWHPQCSPGLACVATAGSAGSSGDSSFARGWPPPSSCASCSSRRRGAQRRFARALQGGGNAGQPWIKGVHVQRKRRKADDRRFQIYVTKLNCVSKLFVADFVVIPPPTVRLFGNRARPSPPSSAPSKAPSTRTSDQAPRPQDRWFSCQGPTLFRLSRPCSARCATTKGTR